MGIRLARSARPEAVAVMLKGGAVWLRPATALDVEMARAEAVRLFAGVLAGSQALAALSRNLRRSVRARRGRR